MKRETPKCESKDAVATAEALFSLGLSEARAIVSGLTDEARSKMGSWVLA